MRRRISRLTARTLPWYLRLYGVMIGASIPAAQHQRGSLYGIPRDERFERWTMADLAFLAMTGKKPTAAQARPLQVLIGLLISNGPGAISAQGAKGAVSADGPQTPGARADQQGDGRAFSPTPATRTAATASRAWPFCSTSSRTRASLTRPTRSTGSTSRQWRARSRAPTGGEGRKPRRSAAPGRAPCPGVHHPVFKGKPVNYDPRERFIAEVMAARGDYNVFHDFYRHLVQALYEEGASPCVFCVNVDAVIAALLLALLWKDYRSGALSERDLETAAFTVFLYGRMIGCAAEIDDHLNRGRNMDTRTPASACAHVV